MNVTQLNIDEIKKHYRFEERDREELLKLYSIFEEKSKDILDKFYEFILSFPHSKTFLSQESILQNHRRGLNRWLLALFSGRYDEDYLIWLFKIKEIHIHIGLSSHYLFIAFSYIRELISNTLIELGYLDKIIHINKILDINLEIINPHQDTTTPYISDIIILKSAIDTSGVTPFVQPIVDTSSGEIFSYESLMRIQNPYSKKYLSIAPYIQIAKDTHIYNSLVDMMIDKTLDIFSKLPYRFSLNIGYGDITNDDFISTFLYKIETFPNPSRITIEILESDIIEDFKVITSFISDIKKLGCSIAIDDFGSGYSNIDNILKFNPDYIKIDGSLIETIVQEPKKELLLKNIVKMVKDIDTKVVAEYISSKEIYDLVCSIGVDYLQGFYLFKPFDARELFQDPKGSIKGGNESIQKEEK